jgi:hypothetical protein
MNCLTASMHLLSVCKLNYTATAVEGKGEINCQLLIAKWRMLMQSAGGDRAIR